jgi:hypothetical protein
MLRAISEERRQVLYFRPRCKSWNCPVCADINARQWRAKIVDACMWHIDQGHKIAFTTLTTHEKLSPRQSVSLFPSQWKKLRQRANRASGGGEYVMVPELHKSGKLHMHMLDTFGLTQTWWKKNARSSGMGYMAESEFARTIGGVTSYVSKYVTKGLSNFPLMRFRRIRKSQGFLKPSDGDGLMGWAIEVLPADVSLLADSTRHELAGYQVRVIDHWEVYEQMHSEE